MNVLIAEDDVAAAETLREYLESRGFVCAVENSEDGAFKRLVSDLDAAILDVKIHGAPVGFDLLAELKRRNPDVMAIVVTGYDISESRIKSLEMGADFFFPKPLDLKLLSEQLEARGSINKN